MLNIMTLKGGSSAACAACKYQRRRCSSECILAPYFPANQPKVFQNVHRLYGVSKIMNLLKELRTTEQREDAMKSIKYESDMRSRFPVHGCLTIIYQLRQQLQQAVQELQSLHAQIAICRDQFDSSIMDPPAGGLQFLGIDPHLFAATDFEIPLMIKTPDYYNANFTESSHDDNVCDKPLLGPDTYSDLMRDNAHSSVPVHQQTQWVPSVAFGNHQERADASHEGYGDMFFNSMADDRQSYVETNEACESSSESSLRYTNEQVTYSELRSAAACFGLTSVKSLEQSQ